MIRTAPSTPMITGIAVVGSLLPLLDSTIVNISLHATADRFGTITDVQWVVTGYLLALAATMPVTAWLARRYGRYRTFLVAVIAFAAGSVVCAVSPSLEVLIAGRVLTGAAGGVLAPISTVVLTAGVPRERLGAVQSLNGTVMLAGPLIGPTVGGVLLEHGGWRSIYWVAVPVCVVVVALALVALPRDAGSRSAPLDVPGLVSGSAGVTALVFALREAAVPHRDPVEIAALTLLAVGGTALFIRRELTAEHPLLNLRLYADRRYAWASACVALVGMLLYAPMVIVPLYLQSERGESAIRTGLIMSFGGIGAIVMGARTARIVQRLGAGRTLLIGLAVVGASTVPLMLLTATTPIWIIAVTLVVRGIGVSLSIVPAMTSAFVAITPQDIPDASPQLNLLQRIGGALAVTGVTIVMQSDGLEVGAGGPVLSAFTHGFDLVLVVTVVTGFAALGLVRAEARERAPKQTELVGAVD
ncbi:hypothetical protein AXK57_07570 [Tsukamurella pulmonis]|uniref:Drug resistance transporter, EmrB/QacA subfamily n=1 Tax=Tsukamurella pulmonis TaxID=47312 RepID=A0A1H1CES4_9ACTN|nr:DHA2 family efflux MFS transporter permease subunit [Tsukamurella pulmonis]KXO89951.1 hypothetical protein AXK56_07325 [Tsukamurella pulmonis]KXP11207.1 hypothetical protein AXK57_07570 [Tsukamurella pulmonis]RDH11279.1 MFS transporter [Tsukamurella pulmonis]SDQ62166.1 drug resistance transporter, EmrB/QacA subfamily [Tsukamurella pulmonis]SUP23847.1 Multidrug resistance protein B [Tsukamurella pulmonis]